MIKAQVKSAIHRANAISSSLGHPLPTLQTASQTPTPIVSQPISPVLQRPVQNPPANNNIEVKGEMEAAEFKEALDISHEEAQMSAAIASSQEEAEILAAIEASKASVQGEASTQDELTDMPLVDQLPSGNINNNVSSNPVEQSTQNDLTDMPLVDQLDNINNASSVQIAEQGESEEGMLSVAEPGEMKGEEDENDRSLTPISDDELDALLALAPRLQREYSIQSSSDSNDDVSVSSRSDGSLEDSDLDEAFTPPPAESDSDDDYIKIHSSDCDDQPGAPREEKSEVPSKGNLSSFLQPASNASFTQWFRSNSPVRSQSQQNLNSVTSELQQSVESPRSKNNNSM